MKINPTNLVKLLLIMIGFFIVSIHSTQAATYSWYFSNSTGSDTTGNGTEGSPWKSIAKMKTQLAALVYNADTAIFKLKSGDTWVLRGPADLITVEKPNVTFTKYGNNLLSLPTIDGNMIFPADNYAVISIGGTNTSQTTTNVHVSNIRIQNAYPGTGIQFYGLKSTIPRNWEGPGSITDCEFDTIGGAAISIWKVENSAGTTKAIKIERNRITKTGEYPKRENPGVTWPQAITTNNSVTFGHECRHNYIYDIYGEGIGGMGFDIIEYNMISGTKTPGIYIDSAKGTFNTTIIARYNLCWGDSTSEFTTGTGIRLNDEFIQGNNNDLKVEIYGNVVVGCYYGITLRNLPKDAGAPSAFGNVKVYNNTLIDNTNNFWIQYPENFTTVDIKNNALITNAGVAGTEQLKFNSVPTGFAWSGWSFINQYFYGGGYVSDSQISNLAMPFRNGTHTYGTIAPYPPKMPSWRALSSLNDFSFSDLYPSSTSQLVDNAGATVIYGYGQYLTDETNWNALPRAGTFILTDQNTQGADWDFGAIINQQSGGDIMPPSAPQGLNVN